MLSFPSLSKHFNTSLTSCELSMLTVQNGFQLGNMIEAPNNL
jgi:hypothetical protein